MQASSGDESFFDATNGGSIGAEVRIDPAPPPGQQVVVTAATSDYPPTYPDPRATAGVDYRPVAAQLIFDSNNTFRHVWIPFINDTQDEADIEYFSLTATMVSDPGTTAESWMGILDDDPPGGTPGSTVDLDVDSDNTAVIEGSQLEENDEEKAPGLIVKLNDDDDDLNGKADLADLQFSALDDDFYPALINLNATGGQLTITGGGGIRLWQSGTKTALPLTYDIAVQPPPASFSIEGVAIGQAWIETVLTYQFEGLVHTVQDRVLITVAKVNATAFRPQNPIFSPLEVPESQEHDVRIRRNGDDDNKNGTNDREDPIVGGENDLIETLLQGGGHPGTQLVATRSSGTIALYDNIAKDGDLFGSSNSVVLPMDGFYWVEYTSTGSESAILTLMLRDALHGRDVPKLSDSLTFRPLDSIVVAILGHGSVAVYPPPPGSKSPGVYQMAYQLYSEGYDAFLFPEDAVNYPVGDDWSDAGKGDAYNLVENAVNKQGVDYVGIFGHSHGGGATKWLAYALNASLTIAAHELRFTGYIDAIQRGTKVAETERPLGSLFHLNQWQENDLFVTGAATIGADENEDRTNLGVIHVTIPNHADVQELLLTRLRSNVPN